MPDLPKLTLSHNEKKSQWELRRDGSGRLVDSFDTKAETTAGGALEEALGNVGGSVKIQKLNGQFQEERTYPRSSDPKESKG